MVNVVGSRDDYSRWKPANMLDHKTVQELADLVSRSVSSIYKAERQGRIPKPVRVKAGRLRVRLYSPAECDKIKAHFDTVRSGPKPK